MFVLWLVAVFVLTVGVLTLLVVCGGAKLRQDEERQDDWRREHGLGGRPW